MKSLFTLFLCLFLLFLCCPESALCSDERDMEREAAIWQELEAINPAAVKIFKEATVAHDAGDTTRATELYRKVLVQAPGFNHAQRRLGMRLAAAGRANEARALLDSALQSARSPENLFSLGYFLMTFDASASEALRYEEALPFVREAAYSARKDVDYTVLYAQCALAIDMLEDFRNATAMLKASYPNNVSTHYYSSIVAVMDEDWETAEKEIQLAVEAGFPPELAASFLEGTGAANKAAVWRYFYYSLYVVAAWIAGLLFLFIAGKICSSRTLHFIENDDPNAVASDREKALRSFYKKLITAAGVYYYISLPLVAAVILAMAGSVTYAAFEAGRIPIKLLAFVDIGALITVFFMVRTLFIKPVTEDPGRALLPEEAPELWNLAREVAATVGTRPIDEIRVVPATELAVYERGSARERAEDKAHRILILGVGVLDDFDNNAFRSVLAHEYGHFTHRDTAGGEVAMRVNRNMHNLLIAMIQAEQAVWWNLGFWFLRIYIVLFRRISHGATRLQEVMADRVAVLHYGADAFRTGLSHVIKRSVEFHVLAVREINNAHLQGRPLHNLYELKMEEDDTQERNMADTQIQEAMAKTTDVDDTHPSPSDRFRLAGRIRSNEVQPIAGNVWDLFTGRAELTSEMSRQIREEANASGSVSIPVGA